MNSSPLKNEKLSDNYSLAFFLPLASLLSALLLLPLEKILPYPHIIEEITKTVLVFFVLVIPGKAFQFKLTILLGFLFALSENIFYLTNPQLYQFPLQFLQRIAVVSFFHIFTMLILLLAGQKKRWLIFPTLIFTMFLHFFYNQNIAYFFSFLF